MYGTPFMRKSPNGAANNGAVEISKPYKPPGTVKFITGFLGSFARQELPDETGKREEAAES